tara:strand:+ start:3776 stop:3919 length:144 start_codon:yes stop_codon:yes gene_type:complete
MVFRETGSSGLELVATGENLKRTRPAGWVKGVGTPKEVGFLVVEIPE